jgi:arylsulfatase A-like enzyme
LLVGDSACFRGRPLHRTKSPTSSSALRDLGLENDTIVVFASDNGPQGAGVRELGGDMPDMGSPGPYRGELGYVSEGSIRTAAVIRWPGRIRSRASYAMSAPPTTIASPIDVTATQSETRAP